MPRPRVTTALLLALTVLVIALAWLAHDRAQLPVLVPLAFLTGAIVWGLWQQDTLQTRHVLVFAILFRLVLVGLPPSLSDDAFRYLWDGLVQVNGINPYHYVPQDAALSAFHREPIYEALNSKGYFSVYPPLSQLVFAFGALFYPFGWQVSYFVIKAVFVLFELGALLLISRIVTARWLMLYALHPLVLLETAGQAHTESAMVFFLVATVFLARQEQGGWAAVALSLAGWVKLFPFLLMPFLWRRFGWRSVWVSGLMVVLVALPYAAPYVLSNVQASLDLYARLFEFNAGFYYSIKEYYFITTGADWSKQIGPTLRQLFLISVPVLYVLDARLRWPLARAFLVTIGFFLVMATTVHPWYFLGVLALIALLARPAWHWQWLGLCALGTYLLYIDGPYWFFVIAGWGGWLLLALMRYMPIGLQVLQQARARRKIRFVEPFIPRLKKPLEVLDLGAGEGYVGQVLTDEKGARVTLADVVPMNQTRLPHVLYDGSTLPFADNAFDVTVLYFVLHHAEHQEEVLLEALRVSRSRVLIVESVYKTTRGLQLLTFLDKLANRIRSSGHMKGQEGHLHFRTVEAWRSLFAKYDVPLITQRRRGRWIHKQALFVVTRSRDNGC
ncbi:MAG TPA: methyltransferase domain-containing protein [Rhodothermales bacterium]|nr:methyltransferase domain-containing protein [Rhodothermales bacterium]